MLPTTPKTKTKKAQDTTKLGIQTMSIKRRSKTLNNQDGSYGALLKSMKAKVKRRFNGNKFCEGFKNL